MELSDVRIVKLEPMRVVVTSGFSAEPEMIAWGKLCKWAASKGLFDLKQHRFFGFNNPNPTPGSPNYGYEQWMTIAPETTVEVSDDVAELHYRGGLYAVASCNLTNIYDTWQALVKWRETSKYLEGHHNWLEQSLNPEIMINPGDPASSGKDFSPDGALFDLYLPIRA